MYFGSDDASYKTYFETALKLDATFMHSFDAKLKNQMKGATVSLFKDFDEGKNDFSGEFTPENL